MNKFFVYVCAVIVFASSSSAEEVVFEKPDLTYRLTSLGAATFVLAGVAVAATHSGATATWVAKSAPRVLAGAFVVSFAQRTLTRSLNIVTQPIDEVAKNQIIAPFNERLGYGLAMYYDFGKSLGSDGAWVYSEYVYTFMSAPAGMLIGVKDYFYQWFFNPA